MRGVEREGDFIDRRILHIEDALARANVIADILALARHDGVVRRTHARVGQVLLGHGETCLGLRDRRLRGLERGRGRLRRDLRLLQRVLRHGRAREEPLHALGVHFSLADRYLRLRKLRLRHREVVLRRTHGVLKILAVDLKEHIPLLHVRALFHEYGVDRAGDARRDPRRVLRPHRALHAQRIDERHALPRRADAYQRPSLLPVWNLLGATSHRQHKHTPPIHPTTFHSISLSLSSSSVSAFLITSIPTAWRRRMSDIASP